MKKLFVQLGQLVLRYKKRLIYGALALFIGQVCFFGLGGVGVNNAVYAEDGNNATQNAKFQEKATNWLQDFSFLNRACYILLYPILILAGALVNNSFVYAEVFKFDVVLWQLWNVVRNLANYALGFIFVFKIFQFLLSGQKSGDMTKLLRSTLIAGIGIQASWFLLAVLIDVSNILTYSVGGLPIHILGKQDLGENTDFGNPYVYQTVVSVDFNDPDTVHTYFANTLSGESKAGDNFIAECETFSFKNEELIVAPKIIYYYDGTNYHPTQQLICHVGDDVFNLNGLESGIEWQSCGGDTCKDLQNTYKDSLTNKIEELKAKSSGAIEGSVANGTILQIKNAHVAGSGVWSVYEGVRPGLDVDNKVNGETWNMKKLHDILEGDDGYIGVFSALYSSLLNAGSNFRVSDAGIYKSLLNTLLSLCHTLAVGVPLLAMLVVFFMRIGVIWMAIILSPAIVLMEAFGWSEKVKDLELLKYLTVGNLIGIIFSPAIICFAVSISTVLVRIICNVNASDVLTQKTSILGGLFDLNIEGMGLGMGKFICSVIGIAISWFLIWSAVKASALGEKVKGLEKLARSAIGSIPLIPVPGKNGEGVDYIGMDKAFGLNGQTGMFSEITSTIRSKYENEDNKALQSWLNPEKAKEEAGASQLSAYKEKLTSSTIGSNWGASVMYIGENKNTPKTFGDFNGLEQESIITAINELGKDRLKDIPEGHEITLNGSNDKYKFVTTRQKKNDDGTVVMEDVYKYEKQETS